MFGSLDAIWLSAFVQDEFGASAAAISLRQETVVAARDRNPIGNTDRKVTCVMNCAQPNKAQLSTYPNITSSPYFVRGFVSVSTRIGDSDPSELKNSKMLWVLYQVCPFFIMKESFPQP